MTMVEVTPSARERPSVAFGPSSLGEVPPPTLEQIVLRARVRLGERGRLAGRLLFGAGLAFGTLFAWDLMDLIGTINSTSQLSASFLFGGILDAWALSLLDAAIVFLELVLVLFMFVEASRFGAGHSERARFVLLAAALALVIYVPAVITDLINVWPVDWVSGALGLVFPILGLIACALALLAALIGRVRPVPPYEG